MLPKRLTIQGLYSYQKPQTIDFSVLTEAGLFGIFGAVGSGKSSILEAIGFALYGQTERLDKDKRNYNMMNLKSNELLIDFEFLHHDQSLYRFTVKGKRNRNRFNEVKAFDRSAYKFVDGEWSPLESADATNILDLSYDNFRRTIIIPQGKFQEFLQLGAKDRSEMMMDIFHLHKYDLSNNAKQLETENELALADLHGQLKKYVDASEDELKTKQEQQSTTIKNSQALQSNIEKLEQLFSDSKKLKEQFDTLLQYRTNYNALETQKDIFAKKQKALEVFQQAKLYFEPNLQRKQTLEKTIQNRNIVLQKNIADLSSINERIQQQTQQWQSIQQDYAQLDSWQKQIQEIQIAQDILQYQKQQNELQDKINAGKVYIDKEEQTKENLTQQCTELEKNIQAKKANQPSNIFIFNEVGEWFQQKKNLQKQLADTEQQILVQQERIEKGKQLFPNLSLHFENWQKEADDQKSQYKKTLENLQEKKNKLSLQSELHQYAQNLQDGNPCPLCGALHHPSKLENDADIFQELNNIEQAIHTNNQALSILEANITKATNYAAGINTCEEQVRTLTYSREQLSAQLISHQNVFQWNGFDADNENGFLEKKQTAEKDIAEIKQLELNLSERTKQLNTSKDTLNKFQNALTERQAQYTSAQENAQHLLARLQLISREEIEQKSSEQYAQQQTTLANKIAETKAQYESLQKQLQELDKNKAVLSSEIQSVQLEREKETTELTILETQIQQLLQQHQIQSEQSVWIILEQQIDIQKENASIQQYQNQLFAAKEKVEQLAAQLQGKNFDETQWQQEHQDLQIAKASLTDYTTTIAQLTLSIEQLTQDLNSKKELEQQLQQKTLRKDNIKTLRNLFEGKAFVNYISSVYLKNLCVAANERFSKLTHNQLHLELGDNNEFLILDLLNEGKTRSAKTLSGGQTFQASLSLALALADSVQYQNKSEQNFFFLDEGFGSLDKEALATIYDTLKSLRKENRIVGIISHVEDLQQEIPVSLLVQNDVEKGSQIKFLMS